MDDSFCRQFFAQPDDVTQRRYEALRAVFMEGRSQKEVADTFGYHHNTIRQMVCDFRAACANGHTPPFFFPPSEAGPSARRGPASPRFPNSPRWRTGGSSNSPPPIP